MLYNVKAGNWCRVVYIRKFKGSERYKEKYDKGVTGDAI